MTGGHRCKMPIERTPGTRVLAVTRRNNKCKSAAISVIAGAVVEARPHHISPAKQNREGTSTNAEVVPVQDSILPEQDSILPGQDSFKRGPPAYKLTHFSLILELIISTSRS